MKKVILTILIALSTILSTSGCTPKREVYIPVTFEFQDIDLRGVYVEMDSKMNQSVCTPYMNQLEDVLGGTIKFYVDQNQRYRLAKKANSRAIKGEDDE